MAVVRKRRSNIYNELRFTLIKEKERKYTALCKICKKTLQNTSQNRLRAHRNVCHQTEPARDRSISPLNNNPLDTVPDIKHEEDIMLTSIQNWETIEICPDGSYLDVDCEVHSTASSTLSLNMDNTRISRPNSVASSVHSSSSNNNNRSKSIERPTCKSNEITGTSDDKLNANEENVLNSCLADLIFGCNMPCSIVESAHFKNFIKTIRPEYLDKIPSKKTLSTTLLDKTYEKCIAQASYSLNPEAVLLIDGRKSSANNMKETVMIGMLHNSDGAQAFLNTWNLSAAESESEEKLTEIVTTCVDLAKQIYKTNIYAIVSANAVNHMKKINIVHPVIWHTTCNSHIANLLVNDVLDKKCTDQVFTILNEFKRKSLEKALIDKGGVKIKVPCETQLYSYRNAYSNLINNLHHIKLVAAAAENIKHEVTNLIFDDEFIKKVTDNIELFDPICQLINTCESATCSNADAVQEWFNLKLPPKFIEKFQRKLELRKNMALNIYALAAYYLHPRYDNSRLDALQTNKINMFLVEQLNAEGIKDLCSYKKRERFFKMLYDKEIQNPLVFWSTAEMEHPNLAKFARKLLLIPATSTQLDRVVSNSAQIHSVVRPTLTPERSKTLQHVHYQLRIVDSNHQSMHYDD